MKVNNWIGIILTGLLIQGCASLSASQQLQGAKRNFEQGDFKSAFGQAMPLAAEGNPQAEYVVGYMYYYGYGVPQDTQSGLFWIKKSAEAHYPKAVQSVDLISKNKPI